jgi:TPR repeat protein
MARIEYASDEVATTGSNVTSDVFFHLGVTYATGRNGGTDLVAAHKWFNLAAHRGNADAARYRQEISAEMSAADIAAAQRLAREYLTVH